MALDVLITCFLIFLNGFFVAAEFAIVKVRISQLEMKLQNGNRAALLAKNIVSHLDGYLAATQLGITLASLGLGWIGEPVVSKIILSLVSLVGIHLSEELGHQIALPIAFSIITILHIVFGELAPKSIAIQRSETTTLFIAYPLRIFYIVFRPFIWLLNGIASIILKALGVEAGHESEVHSSEELRYLVQQGKESGTIDEAEYDIIKNAFDFSERTAKQTMVPRTNVLAMDVNNFNDAMLEKIIEEGYSRIPCYEDDLDKSVGVVYLKDMLLKIRRNEPINIREIMRPVLAVPGTKRIGQLLKDFQLKHQQIAIVINEYGGTDGIITMEDILEELVGEIQDEYDDEIPFVEKVSDKTYTALATVSLDDINEFLPHPIRKGADYETLAGCLIVKSGRIPGTNDKISFDGYEFTILKRSKNSIVLVQLFDLKN
jgi:CBS domain containing-hemolysin-like protein